jgi:hypothetical protein
MQPLNVFGYRSLGLDEGLPAVRSIFKNGFALRSPDSLLAYRTHVDKPIVTSFEGGAQSFPKAGDILPDTGHCFAQTLPGCTVFPNDTAKVDTWIFVCFLREGFNTYAQQRRDVALIHKYYPGLAPHAQQIAWPLAAFEVAVESVAPGDILAAIPCTKAWSSDRWEDGGTFTLHLDRLVMPFDLRPQMRLRILAVFERYRQGVIPPTPI